MALHLPDRTIQKAATFPARLGPASPAKGALLSGGCPSIGKGLAIAPGGSQKGVLPEKLLDLDVFLAFDYSQLEIRILAELSQDPLLISQFRSGLDIHCAVGNALTGWSFERIKQEKNLRKMVKNMHFGIVFGINEDNVYDYVVAKIREIDGEDADLTGITPATCKKCYRAYFKRYAGVARFIDKMRAQAESEGFVETLFGFRRTVYQEDDTRETYWGNQAINSPVQGSAHTLVLIAMALLHRKPRSYNLLWQRPVMEVHDALFHFVKLRDLAAAYHQGKQLLETEVVAYTKKHFGKTLQVPLIAEAEAGFCLGSMVEFNAEPLPEFLEKWRAKYYKVEKESWKTLLPQYN